MAIPSAFDSSGKASYRKILLSILLFLQLTGFTQSSVSYNADQSTTGYTLKKAFALPAGKSGIISLTTASHFFYTVINNDGSVAGSFDFTGQLSLQNAAGYIEINATGTAAGNAFITYTSWTTTGMTNQNARFLVLNQTGATVGSGNVNASNLGTSLNRYLDLAVLSNGNIAAVWLGSDDNSCAFRIFSETGTTVTGDVVFAGPASAIFPSTYIPFGSKVAASTGGGFLVSFTYGSGDFRAIRFNNAGTVQTTGGINAFVVDATTNTGNYKNYRAAGLSNGSYMLLWKVAGTGYYKVIDGSGADVRGKTALTDPDLAREVSTNGYLDAVAVNTSGKQGFALCTNLWQAYSDLSNPYIKVKAYNYDLSGNFLSSGDLTPYFIADAVPLLSLYSGQPSGVGVAYRTYKTYTPVSGGFTVPADADLGGNTLDFSASTLPVNLVAFDASLQGNGSVLLKWTTTGEEGNKQYLVQRSTDGRLFETIGRVSANLNNSGGQYQYIDRRPVTGDNYYRLWQEDLNGRTRDLGVRLVKNDRAVASRIFPNPVTQGSFTLFSNKFPQRYDLFDGRGKRLQTGMVTANSQVISISTLPAGVYFLRFSSGQTISIEKK